MTVDGPRQGAQEIFREMPHEMVSAADLPLLHTTAPDPYKVYGCVVSPADYVVPADAPPFEPEMQSPNKARRTHQLQRSFFDKKHYYAQPEKYRCEFHLRVRAGAAIVHAHRLLTVGGAIGSTGQIAPYVSAIVNGIYWERRFPRLLTKDQLSRMLAEGRSRLLAVADISADPDVRRRRGAADCDRAAGSVIGRAEADVRSARGCRARLAL